MHYTALLPPGTHLLDLSELYQLVVCSFAPNHGRREHLFQRLKAFLNYFRLLGFNPAEIYLDGSFLTSKTNPSDIDILLVLNMGEVAALPRKVQDLLYKEFGDGAAKSKFECEVVLAPSADFRMIENRLNFFRNLDAKSTFKKKGIVKLKEL
jgi:predicted nucleotidyltransferase